MRNERKGIRGAVLDGTRLTGWQIYSLPMQTPPTVGIKHLAPDTVPTPHFAAGTFTLTASGDTFLDVRSLGKGLLWINGRCLGRFWNIGPQGTLFLPASWLKKGRNDVVIFDFVSKATVHKLAGLAKPILDVTPPEYEVDIKDNDAETTVKPSPPQE
jgi:beta-galactosidase